MQKITLQPIAKAILHSARLDPAERAGETDTIFDVATAGSAAEKTLGQLYVLSHLKQKDDDLSYLVSLASSLAKREFYAVPTDEPKAAFERTLKKLNEVLEEFFQNKKFDLNLGLLAVSGDQLLLSHLGKFKVALARAGEYIDILNNVGLFNKSERPATQFSNIISGQLLPSDKLFAYFPLRPLVSREKVLNPIFIKQSQDEFADKLAALAANAPNFNCCGVHIAMAEIKESAEPAAVAETTPAPLDEAGALLPKPINQPATAAIGSEVSVAKRANPLRAAAGHLHKLAWWGHLASTPRHLPDLRRGEPDARRRVISAAVVLVAVVVAGWWLLVRAGNAPATAAYTQAAQGLKLAQDKLDANDSAGARALLTASLGQLIGFDNKKVNGLKLELEQLLNKLDRVSDRVPELNAAADPTKLFPALVPKALRAAVGSNPFALYEDNLYVAAGTAVSKYSDAVKGGTKPSNWGTLDLPAVAIAVDGDLYALASDGTVGKYFKGKRSGGFKLSVAPGAGAQLLTGKNSALLYLADPSAKRLYAFDKASGELKTSYRLDAVGTLQQARLASDGTIWLLASDSKVWDIKP